MTYEIGIDVVDVNNFRKSIERTKPLKHKLFTEYEINYCKNKGIEHLASRFAAKEAFFKACNIEKLDWKGIEIRNLKSGKPIIRLSRKIKTKLNLKSIKITLSQTRKNAAAFVMMDYTKK